MTAPIELVIRAATPTELEPIWDLVRRGRATAEVEINSGVLRVAVDLAGPPHRGGYVPPLGARVTDARLDCDGLAVEVDEEQLGAAAGSPIPWPQPGDVLPAGTHCTAMQIVNYDGSELNHEQEPDETTGVDATPTASAGPEDPLALADHLGAAGTPSTGAGSETDPEPDGEGEELTAPTPPDGTPTEGPDPGPADGAPARDHRTASRTEIERLINNNPDRTWTAAQVAEHVDMNGSSITPTLSWLHRANRIRRVGRGQYQALDRSTVHDQRRARAAQALYGS